LNRVRYLLKSQSFVLCEAFSLIENGIEQGCSEFEKVRFFLFVNLLGIEENSLNIMIKYK